MDPTTSAPAGDLSHPASYVGFAIALLLSGLGLPVPEDGIVMGGGYLVYRGFTAMWPTVAISFAGVIAGDIAIFFMGRGVGAVVLGRPWTLRHVNPKHVARARRFVERFGAWAIFIARFVMGLRSVTYLSAGALRMPFARFFAANLAAASLSVPLFLWLGWRFGGQIDWVVQLVLRIKLILLVSLGFMLLLYVIHKRTKRSMTPPPTEATGAESPAAAGDRVSPSS